MKPLAQDPLVRRCGHAGMTLLEVLVAILILSFGLLGFVRLQAKAIQYSVGAEDSNRAALLANELAATMQLYQTVNLQASMLSSWQARVANASLSGLPGGTGSVSALNGSTATITISWLAVDSPASSARHSYVTTVAIP